MGLGRPVSAYEGQLALEWNLAADIAEPAAYAFDIVMDGEPWMVDLRPAVRQAVDDLVGGRGPGLVSMRFHNALIQATAQLLRQALERHGPLPIVLTGGCFQNALLTMGVFDALKSRVPVYLHGEVPPGDGGIALGQALVADAVARESL
jgi:hydrogenase maturation protein HypF